MLNSISEKVLKLITQGSNDSSEGGQLPLSPRGQRRFQQNFKRRRSQHSSIKRARPGCPCPGENLCEQRQPLLTFQVSSQHFCLFANINTLSLKPYGF